MTNTEQSFDALRDTILRGVAHALSNRVAALGGISSVADPGKPWTEKLSQLLNSEAKRLEDILRLLRLLPNDGRGESGALELQPLMPDIVALHAFNSSLLQVPCEVAYDRETMPVFANRPRLVHALLLMIDTAKRQAQRDGGRVAISYNGDAERVTIRVATERGTGAGPTPDVADDGAPGSAATELALRSALAQVAGEHALEFFAEGRALRMELTVPTLAAGRRTERAAAAARPTA